MYLPVGFAFSFSETQWSSLTFLKIRKRRPEVIHGACPKVTEQRLQEDADGASLVVQWLRICLPVQGTRVRALVREDPTCHGATKPVRHNYWACESQLLKHVHSRTYAPQEKPPQWEACALHQRVVPARHNKRKPVRSNEDPTQPKVNK